MIGKLIVSHGPLAQELLAAAEAVAGDRDNGLQAVCLEWEEGYEEAEARIAREVRNLDEGEGVLILTDMFGNTPYNAALALVVPERVEVVSGVNLPMVVRIACATTEPQSVTELASWIRDKGRDSIRTTARSQRSETMTTGPR